jgi:hypothetical protein
LSLKAFHIFFIAVSVLLALGFGVWSLYIYLLEEGGVYLVMGLLALLAAGGLVYYAAYFLHKLKHVK